MLNFESRGHFFGQLTEKRWEIVRSAQGKEELSVRELARSVGRDVKRLHEDVVILAGLGLPFSLICLESMPNFADDGKQSNGTKQGSNCPPL